MTKKATTLNASKKQLNYDVPSETVVGQSIVEFFTVISKLTKYSNLKPPIQSSRKCSEIRLLRMLPALLAKQSGRGGKRVQIRN
ncbi:hypothetical protein TYRP_006250 [Tyrophagus putrescentiae]|nr:hypothetical protein TYRP_006250 [Tyrophagus putrescentiae]